MIRWAEQKDRWLRRTRGISFEEIAERILAGQYLDILENPAGAGQEPFVLRLQGYTWVVPKTAYPSRKLHRRYGGSGEEGSATHRG